MNTLSPTSSREAVHVLILRKLVDSGREQDFVLKGGVNLRLFFDSVRYSEDMDLDGNPSAAEKLKSAIQGIFGDTRMNLQLRETGIRGLDPGEGPNEDTTTTFRYKFGVMMQGGIRHSTKIEISYRERHPADEVLLESVDPAITAAHLGSQKTKLEVPHYSRTAAARQKINALVGRPLVQARDIFDLFMLEQEEANELPSHLASVIPSKTLEEAHHRALDVSYAEYRGQVLEFLDEYTRQEFQGQFKWDEIRLAAASLIERTAALKTETEAK